MAQLVPAGQRSMSRNVDLGTLLRMRRARVNPADIGLQPTHHRRVPGLRREELAVVAGISPDYYTRLEQGRQATASPSVLDAIAEVLQLTPDERRHLYALAGAGQPRSTTVDAHEKDVDPGTQRVVELLGDTPAVVCGPYTDILAANDAARFLLGDITSVPRCERYAVRWILSPETRALYGAE